MEHQISAYINCNHGQGVAVLHPAYYRHIYRDGVLKFARFAQNVWGISADGRDEYEQAEAGIGALENFIREIGLPATLRELGMKDKKQLREIAESCHYSPGGYRRLDSDEVLQIFEECF